ncbi:MAG: CpXC domain-containing protein [Elusimicrobia bacterium]|nr:CpXC domain-containing protein [Elusimicrobiota bacterium]
MSIKGVIEARCPQGCEPFEAEVWSFINGDRSPELREAVAAKEMNLLICPACGAAFFADAPYIFFAPAADILFFVFPASFQAEESRWRLKMAEDFKEFKKAMGDKLPLDLEPEICFGPETLGALLSEDDYRGEEVEVMEFVARELGLSLYHVRPGLARRLGIPASLPYAPARKGAGITRANMIAGLETLLAANDRLTAYQSYLGVLRTAADGALPPALR